MVFALVNIGQLFTEKNDISIIDNHEESEFLLFRRLKDFKKLENQSKESIMNCNKSKKEYCEEIADALKDNLKKKGFINGVFDGEENKELKTVKINNEKTIYIAQIDQTNILYSTICNSNFRSRKSISNYRLEI